VPLDTTILPGVYAAVERMVPSLIAGASIGPTSSIPQDPWAWVQTRALAAPEQEGSDLETSDWEVEILLFCTLAPDRVNAEQVLAALIEPMRQQFRSKIKMGQPQIARARIASGAWGYMLVNGVEYRTVSLVCSVREKTSVTYAA